MKPEVRYLSKGRMLHDATTQHNSESRDISALNAKALVTSLEESFFRNAGLGRGPRSDPS